MGVPLTAATAAYDFRRSSPLANLGTGGSGLDLTANGTPTHTVGTGYVLNGTSQWLSDADADDYDFTGAQVGTIYVAVTVSSLAAASTVVAKRSTASSTAGTAAGWVMTVSTNGSVTGRASDGATVTAVGTPAAAVVAGTRVALAFRIGATHCRAFANGTPSVNAVARPVGSLVNAEEFRVGRLSGAGGTYLPGTVHQVIVRRIEDDDTTVAAISAWLLSPTAVGEGPRTLTASVPARTLTATVPARTLTAAVPTRTLETS